MAVVGVLIMPKRIEYKKGEIIGGYKCQFIRDDGTQRTCRMAIFKCGNCGKEFRASISAVKINNTTACGCRHMERAKIMNRKHGLRSHVVYHKWCDVKARCFKKDHHDYGYYGGRGITMYEPWINDFQTFYDYVTSLPNYDENNLGIGGVTIDRHPDNDGNYEPGNVRWATMSEQSFNRRPRQSKSGYRGLAWHKSDKRWVATVVQDGKKKYAGSSKDKKEALEKLNTYIIAEKLTYYKTQEWRG